MNIQIGSLDRSNTVALYTQLVDSISAMFASGALRPGMRLPSERDLASRLGISRTTAINAYRELEARGLVRRQVGRGTVISAGALADGHSASPIRDAPFAWQGKLALGAERALDPGLRSLVAPTKPGSISFAAGTPALDRFPLDRFRQISDRVLQGDPEEILGLGPTEGRPALRREIARRYGLRPEQILVVAGAQQGLDLVARCLLDPGDVVVMDRPGYLGAIHAFRATGARLVGWDAVRRDLDELEDLLIRYRPKLLYSVPTFHNPTGATLSLSGRRDLLELAARFRLPIIEDDPYRELYFRSPPPASLYELDERGLVIYLGTFSKSLATGLRLGWLAASEAIVDQLVTIKGQLDVFCPGPSQAIVTEMLTSRFFDSHVQMMRVEHHCRYEVITGALAQYVPEGLLAWRGAEGGMYLWCQIGPGVSMPQLVQDAPAAGVAFVDGELFYPDAGFRHELRLCFTRNTPERIEEGIRRLGRLLSSCPPASEAGSRPLV